MSDDKALLAEKLPKFAMSGFCRGTLFGIAYATIYGGYYYGKEGLKLGQIAGKIARRTPRVMFFFGLYMGTANLLYNYMLEQKYSKAQGVGAAIGVSYMLMSL